MKTARLKTTNQAKTILSLADIRLPSATLIFIAITLAYLLFAVKANSEVILIPEEPEDPEEMTIQ